MPLDFQKIADSDDDSLERMRKEAKDPKVAAEYTKVLRKLEIEKKRMIDAEGLSLETRSKRLK